jgi:hypothetical protein
VLPLAPQPLLQTFDPGETKLEAVTEGITVIKTILR